jgi:ABC-type transport system involved in multi-copper enzyme maturation permease subunit
VSAPLSLRRELWAVARLDLADVLRSRWILFCVGVYALLGVVFVLVGLRESAIIGFTGMGRVVFSTVHALVLVLPLLALTATGQVINRAREDGTLELLFTLPVRRSTYFCAVGLVRFAALVVPLVGLMLVMAVVSWVAFGEPIAWAFLGRMLGICAALLLAFVGRGLAVSTLVRSPARAMLWLLLLWAGGVALLDFALVGLMLQYRLTPQAVFLVASLNPVEAARLALLSGVSSELSTLGPVGFYLSNRIGAPALLALGLAWPSALGLLAGGLALARFRHADLV